MSAMKDMRNRRLNSGDLVTRKERAKGCLFLMTYSFVATAILIAVAIDKGVI